MPLVRGRYRQIGTGLLPGMRFLIYHGRTQMGSGTVTDRMVYGE
ncbi:MAG: hypothetical protein ACOX6U_01475 [Oscillospiraceae bacterium]